MPRYCAHLGYQFNEVPFPKRFGAAAAVGLRAVEFPAPYTHTTADLNSWLAEAGLAMVQFALPMGNVQRGDKGFVCHPGRGAELTEGIERSIEYAKALDCHRVHAMGGIVPTGVTREAAFETYVENLARVADALAPHGIEVLVEAINSVDVPGYLIDRPHVALDALARCGRANVRYLFDTYHAATMGEDPVAIARAHTAAIGHVQVADFPGRHEPLTGTIDFAGVFAALDEGDFAGWVGCEYVPAGDTAAGLAWRERLPSKSTA